MTADEMVARIERDRREREDAALLLLLALLGRARVNVNRSLRVGGNWRDLLYGTLLGDDRYDLPGGVMLLALLMAETYIAGLRRMARLVGVDLEITATPRELAERFTGQAREVLERIGTALDREIGKALDEAAGADRITADVQAAGGAFRVTGMAEDAAHGAEVEATAVVTVAFAQGVWDALEEPAVRAVLTGMRFVNPLDAKTTDVCRKRDGVKLPPDHPWWFRNWPPLHFGCRSIVLPMTGGGVRFTDVPPDVPPPEPGWGNWAGILSATA